MAPISRREIRIRLLNGLEWMGFSVSRAINVAEELMERILKASGPHWVSYNVYGTGQVRTSEYKTLLALLDAVENEVNFKISRLDMLALQQRFKYGNIIVEINKFIEQQKEVIDTGPIWTSLFSEPVQNSKKAIEERIRLYWERIRQKTIEGGAELARVMTLMTPMEVIKNVMDMVFRKIGVIGSVLGNECIIGAVPIGSFGIDSPTSIQNIEVAHSNRVVKFRAVGSIFLAHQQAGGSDAIKISGKLTGPGRYIFLTALWILSLLTQRYMQLFDWDSPIVTNIGSTKLDVEVFRQTAGPLTPMQKLDDVVVQAPAYEKHITFPVVLDHEIIQHCYIETFSFSETLQGKKDTIEYDLLLRTYQEPSEFLSNTEQTYYGLAKTTKTQEVINYSINFAYRLFRMGQETWFIDNRNWKIKNYYNVDAVDVGMTFAMALGGLIT